MLSFILPLALAAPLVAPGAPLPDASSPVFAQSSEQEQETYAKLLEAYEAAETTWREAVRNAEDARQRKELRAEHPAAEFAERFAAMVRRGDGRGLLWELGVVRYLGYTKSKERKARELEILSELMGEHTGAEWFAEVLPVIVKQRRNLGPEKFEAYLRQIGERSRHPEIQAQAIFTLAQVWGRDEETQAAAMELMKTVAERFPDTEFGRQATDELFRLQYLVVGAEAPDFEASTFDGAAFNLSDHRGKVVVLDFFGFW